MLSMIRFSCSSVLPIHDLRVRRKRNELTFPGKANLSRKPDPISTTKCCITMLFLLSTCHCTEQLHEKPVTHCSSHYCLFTTCVFAEKRNELTFPGKANLSRKPDPISTTKCCITMLFLLTTCHCTEQLHDKPVTHCNSPVTAHGSFMHTTRHCHQTFSGP
jgi:hypothetical protein